jgi:glycosyltransferase involved in cell wall biosynthesis
VVEAAVLNPVPSHATTCQDTSGPLRPLRLIVFVHKKVGVSPGQRFRLEQWAPYAEREHGITLDFVPFESEGLTDILYEPGKILRKGFYVSKDFVRRAGAVLRARHYDGAIIFREAALIGPAMYERLLKRMSIPFLMDFDDAIWLEGNRGGPSANGIFSRLRFAQKAETVCRLATGVTPGNAFLADYARQFNDQVFILPTSIDLASYPVQPELPRDGPFIVCWTGSASTLVHFEHGRAALERLAARRRIVVKVICSKAPERPIAGAETVFIPWTSEGEAEAAGACHVGIMPLPDSDYTRGKCGLKALQFMATGRPAVVSPVGMNKELVEHGHNGFLASTDDEWVEALDELAQSPEKRRRMGSAARATVEARYSARVVAARFALAVRAVIP